MMNFNQTYHKIKAEIILPKYIEMPSFCYQKRLFIKVKSEEKNLGKIFGFRIHNIKKKLILKIIKEIKAINKSKF